MTLICNGNNLANQLRTYGVECEYSDDDCIVLLFSPLNTKEEIMMVSDILEKCSPDLPVNSSGINLSRPKIGMTVRNAVLSDYETVCIDESIGRVCAGVNVPCPPAIPIVASGEIIDENCIKIFKRYGILNVNVVK